MMIRGSDEREVAARRSRRTRTRVVVGVVDRRTPAKTPATMPREHEGRRRARPAGRSSPSTAASRLLRSGARGALQARQWSARRRRHRALVRKRSRGQSRRSRRASIEVLAGVTMRSSPSLIGSRGRARSISTARSPGRLRAGDVGLERVADEQRLARRSTAAARSAARRSRRRAWRRRPRPTPRRRRRGPPARARRGPARSEQSQFETTAVRNPERPQRGPARARRRGRA